MGVTATRKIDQKTEMNQGSEYMSLIEDRLLYKTVDLLSPHLYGGEERQPEVTKRPFQETNGTDKYYKTAGKSMEKAAIAHGD